MNMILRPLKRLWRQVGLRLGFVEPITYTPDANWPDVVNRIVNSRHEGGGAFIVAVETKQGMLQIMSYMQKNGITAIAATSLDLGDFLTARFHNVLQAMRNAPARYQVIIMHKNNAAVGWDMPREYVRWWGHINMLTTFKPREDWLTQFNGRIRRTS